MFLLSGLSRFGIMARIRIQEEHLVLFRTYKLPVRGSFFSTLLISILLNYWIKDYFRSTKLSSETKASCLNQNTDRVFLKSITWTTKKKHQLLGYLTKMADWLLILWIFEDWVEVVTWNCFTTICKVQMHSLFLFPSILYIKFMLCYLSYNFIHFSPVMFCTPYLLTTMDANITPLFTLTIPLYVAYYWMTFSYL